MRKIIVIILLCVGMVSVQNCTDDFDSINSDPKNFTEGALSQAEFPFFVKRALITPTFMPFQDGGRDGRGAFQLFHSLFADIYCNYMATTFANFDSDQYILDGRWLNSAYLYFYTRAAPNIAFAERSAEEFGFDIEGAIVKTYKVFAYHRMTDYWGPIPYSNAGDVENSVIHYDSQQDIYNDFFATLDEAVAVFKANAGGSSFLGGSNDPIYGGDVDSWLTFANTLRLRLAMRIRYADPGKAQTEAEKAVADGVMTENADNAFVATSNNIRNQYNTITQWGEFRMSGDVESILKGYRDPRISKFFAEAVDPDPTDDPPGLVFNYEGFQNGQTKVEKNATPFNSLASDMADAYTAADVPGLPYPVIRAAEAYFLRAEGALLGWNMGGGTAQALYDMGVTTSHEEHGFDGTDLEGNDYLTSANVPLGIDASTPAVSTVPIAYNAAGTTEEQLEQIITQKWIALYPDSEEAYAERRRTGYPTLYDRVNSLNPNIPVDQIPRRMPYVTSEYSTNREAVDAAVANLLGGPDNGTTKLWWDKKN